MMAFIGGCFVGGTVILVVMCCINIASCRPVRRVRIENVWLDVDSHGRVIIHPEADNAGR